MFVSSFCGYRSFVVDRSLVRSEFVVRSVVVCRSFGRSVFVVPSFVRLFDDCRSCRRSFFPCYHDQLLLQYADMTANRQELYATICEATQMLTALTTEATINNYKAHCSVGPANNAPVTRLTCQRE